MFSPGETVGTASAKQWHTVFQQAANPRYELATVDDPLSPSDLLLLSVGFAACCACLAVWAVIGARLAEGRPVLPREPRRLVPWQGIDVLVVMLIYATIMLVLGNLIAAWLGEEMTRSPDIYDVKGANAAHSIVRLVQQADLWILLACGFSAVIVAPIAEEFFFRLLLQGWLEALQGRWQRHLPTLRRLLPGAAGPIVLTSILFGWIHFRVDSPMMHVKFVTSMLAADGVAKLLSVALAIGLVRLRVGATAVDLGWVPEKFFADVRLGLLAFAAVAAPIYAMQYGLAMLLPKYFAPDPLVLFPFALVLGILYWRTHRIVPAIVTHMALNLTTLAMLIVALSLQQ